MSFSKEVKEEVKIKYFTFKNRHSKIHRENDLSNQKQFITDMFLYSGSVSDPTKRYHLEIICEDENKAHELSEAIRAFGIKPKCTIRKEQYVIYLKDSQEISDFLTVIGAHNAVLSLENTIILKEMRETIQRQVNCETANLQKTVSASVRQVNDIKYLRENSDFEALPESLKETAMLRLEYPDATLSELSEMIGNGVGKSGINHRLRKLSEIAEKTRNKNV